MYKAVISTAFFLLSQCNYASAYEVDEVKKYQWKTEYVVDGDTIAITMPSLPKELQSMSIRLLGIDTPETSPSQAKCKEEMVKGEAAKLYLKKWYATTKVVEYDPAHWDKYGGRIDAVVYFDGVNVNSKMVALGFAKHYDGKAKSSWCK